MQESDIQNQIRIALSQYGVPFRVNSGEFYQGTRIFSKEFRQDVLVNLRRVSGLPKGFSDLFFVGKNKVAFIECKKPGGVVREDQIRFLKEMQQLNHYAGVAHNVDEALQIIQGESLI